MNASRRLMFRFVMVVFAVFAAAFFTVGVSKASDAPPRKPVSVEDEIRELKRRVDDADRRFTEQLKTNEDLRAQLGKAVERLEAEQKTREQAVKIAANQAA